MKLFDVRLIRAIVLASFLALTFWAPGARGAVSAWLRTPDGEPAGPIAAPADDGIEALVLIDSSPVVGSLSAEQVFRVTTRIYECLPAGSRVSLFAATRSPAELVVITKRDRDVAHAIFSLVWREKVHPLAERSVDPTSALVRLVEEQDRRPDLVVVLLTRPLTNPESSTAWRAAKTVRDRSGALVVFVGPNDPGLQRGAATGVFASEEMQAARPEAWLDEVNRRKHPTDAVRVELDRLRAELRDLLAAFQRVEAERDQARSEGSKAAGERDRAIEEARQAAERERGAGERAQAAMAERNTAQEQANSVAAERARRRRHWGARVWDWITQKTPNALCRREIEHLGRAGVARLEAERSEVGEETARAIREGLDEVISRFRARRNAVIRAGDAAKARQRATGNNAETSRIVREVPLPAERHEMARRLCEEEGRITALAQRVLRRHREGQGELDALIVEEARRDVEAAALPSGLVEYLAGLTGEARAACFESLATDARAALPVIWMDSPLDVRNHWLLVALPGGDGAPFYDELIGANSEKTPVFPIDSTTEAPDQIRVVDIELGLAPAQIPFLVDARRRTPDEAIEGAMLWDDPLAMCEVEYELAVSRHDGEEAGWRRLSVGNALGLIVMDDGAWARTTDLAPLNGAAQRRLAQGVAATVDILRSGETALAIDVAIENRLAALGATQAVEALDAFAKSIREAYDRLEDGLQPQRHVVVKVEHAPAKADVLQRSGRTHLDGSMVRVYDAVVHRVCERSLGHLCPRGTELPREIHEKQQALPPERMGRVAAAAIGSGQLVEKQVAEDLAVRRAVPHDLAYTALRSEARQRGPGDRPGSFPQGRGDFQGAQLIAITRRQPFADLAQLQVVGRERISLLLCLVIPVG